MDVELSGELVFCALCAVSAVICVLLGRFFPDCLLKTVIQWVLYAVAILLTLVGLCVGIIAWSML